MLESIFNKVESLKASKPTLLKRDSNTSVFLRNLRIFRNTYVKEELQTTVSVLTYTVFINLQDTPKNQSSSHPLNVCKRT